MNFIEAVNFFYKEEKRFNKIEVHVVNGCNINYLSAYLDEKSFCPEVSIVEKDGDSFIQFNIYPSIKEKYSLDSFTERYLKDVIDGRIIVPFTRELFMSKLSTRRQALLDILKDKNLSVESEYNCDKFYKEGKEKFIVYKELPFSTYKDLDAFEYVDSNGNIKTSYLSEIDNLEEFVDRILA